MSECDCTTALVARNQLAYDDGLDLLSGDEATFDTIEAGVAQLKAIIDDAEER
jgi:hypothetical protein